MAKRLASVVAIILCLVVMVYGKPSAKESGRKASRTTTTTTSTTTTTEAITEGRDDIPDNYVTDAPDEEETFTTEEPEDLAPIPERSQIKLTEKFCRFIGFIFSNQPKMISSPHIFVYISILT